jgi:hypothetical protein
MTAHLRASVIITTYREQALARDYPFGQARRAV